MDVKLSERQVPAIHPGLRRGDIASGLTLKDHR